MSLTLIKSIQRGEQASYLRQPVLIAETCPLHVHLKFRRVSLDADVRMTATRQTTDHHTTTALKQTGRLVPLVLTSKRDAGTVYMIGREGSNFALNQGSAHSNTRKRAVLGFNFQFLILIGYVSKNSTIVSFLSIEKTPHNRLSTSWQRIDSRKAWLMIDYVPNSSFEMIQSQ